MLLKYLDIQGFKSFPDKTRITFDKGLTAVVGPNGSGKSNISDAVRWVMGEQSTKTLRGAKMEDVIFAGTKTRKSQGFCEVSLTVDNHNREFAIDSDEVTITRKYYRSGESEYLINKSNVRLKDINEIFMDTGLGKDGYSLVGQGKIAEIVQSKSKERREIFEEAAGISKFRYRKNEAERNLSNAEDNLVRLRDILSELEGRIEPLKEQSEKAKKFLDLSNHKKTLEVSIWNDMMERSNQLLKDQSDKIVISTNKREELEEQIKEIEDKIQSTFQEMQQCMIDIENKRHQKDELEVVISQLTSQIAVCQNDIHHNEQNAARIDSEIENFEIAMQNVNNEINDKEDQIVAINKQIADLEQEIESKQEELLHQSDENENLNKKQHELSNEVNKLLLEQSQMKMTIAQLSMNSSELTASVESNETELKTRKQELESYIKEQASANEFMHDLNDRLESLSNTISGHKIKLENRSMKLNAVKQECEKSDLAIKEKQQKVKLLESLEHNLEGFAYSVKEILKRSKNGILHGVLGTVSQIIDVKSEYSVAIETALSSSMQNIVVENESHAKAAIRMLQQQNLGRATFLPITSVSGSTLNVDNLEQYAGFVDLASNLISYDSKYKNIIESLLGRVVIVDDIDTAVLIAQKNGYKFRIVTLDGQVVNAGGSLSGGSRNKSQGFLSRKNEIQELTNEIRILQEKHQEHMKLMHTLQAEVGQIEAEYHAITSEMQTVNEDKIRIESELKRLGLMMNQIEALSKQMETELKLKQEKLQQNKVESNQCQQNLTAIESKVIEISSVLNTIQASSQGSTEHQTHLADELSQMKIQSVELKKDIEAILLSIEELKKHNQATNSSTAKLQEDKNILLSKNDDIQLQIENYKVDIEHNKSNITLLNEEISAVTLKRQQLEGSTTTLRKEERSFSEQKEKMASEIVRLEERHLAMQREYDEIISKLWEEYELTRSEAQSIAIKLENIPKATTELNSVKSKIRSLGTVNVAAIEEYKEVSERYEFLNSQVKDAEKSRNELIRLIGELTQKMQDIFGENFKKINYQFQRIFVELFGGGKAELKLTEPDNLLESGIEIFVEPPGKIIKNLASLSGGEQSFVAIAIYFAILKVRPAPFCILDEIEAALDDVNVVKYANYLNQMTDKTQFIMITHRRGSMEAADILYGVTMQEEGVSKLLQLNVTDIENNKILNGVN
ncbi:chromosome segregation protein SMC [Paludicola sp. MB14-C6]|uniref:chromosome segregation protein SMC n=1 Tax=Paludihabitans sp. MB14-C6 TaxID=3070656 RepID=UPI0027DDBE4A|nr:chromosome segregation protein SMC [Paludicola sp. MB14-C6]WMJ23683.1 chromosome segregation protein SMC [Paludicola sp. MB14-C6]